MNAHISNREPIAIIGIGCHLPGGATSPGKFWELLINGGDGMTHVPEDRWDVRRFYDANRNRPGKMHIKKAGFIQESIHHFDPLFFDISPREAETLDPQARLMLEVAYRAVEDAGQPIEKLRGSDTGVFVGAFTADNELLHVDALNLERIDSQTACSSSRALLSNRISYFFDWRGPSVAMDTACSSSLVSVHYACQAIWNNECNLALAGGVNAMLMPGIPIAMCKGGFLSEDGYCKTFDASADGYARGEGAGCILLKPLSRAIADGDDIYTTIRATGINQDGHTLGITVPNPDSQTALIRRVCRLAGIGPDELQYVEAHGTGTPTGDPLEIKALHGALSENRAKSNKCYVGSVKTNIGHLEAAAGIAGLIKTALCIKHKTIVKNRHFKNVNPAIDLANLCIKIPIRKTRWPVRKRRIIAGVNSFGYGGTNAHVILESNLNGVQEKHVGRPPRKKRNHDLSDINLLTISAAHESGLKPLYTAYQEFLEKMVPGRCSFHDVVHSMWKRRSHHAHRTTIPVRSKHDAIEKLKVLCREERQPFVQSNRTVDWKKEKLVFVYTGMGPQWWAMGRVLFHTSDVFREKVMEVDAVFQKVADWSILDELLASEKDSRISDTEIAQPANLIIQLGLTALWSSFGVQPDIVVGHSIGEIAAALVSDAITLNDAVKIVYHRSRLQKKLEGKGKMLAVGMRPQDIEGIVSDSDGISIAAINSYSSVTLSGDEDSLQKIASVLDKKNVFNKMLQVEVPYHSKVMELIKSDFIEALGFIDAKPASTPLFSTVSGLRLEGSQFGADYWWLNVRRPVKFARAMANILESGNCIFLEVGPHPVLKHAMFECLETFGMTTSLLHTLKKNEDEWACFYQNLGALHTLGYPVDMDAFIPNENYIRLPNIIWQKQRYWKESKASHQERFGLPGHVMLNNRLDTPNPTWEVEINSHFFPFLNDHGIDESTVFPGASYVEAGFALHNLLSGDGVYTLEKIRFDKVLVIQEERVQRMQIQFHPVSREYEVFSRYKEDDPDWKKHASGRIASAFSSAAPQKINIQALRNRLGIQISGRRFYTEQKAIGFKYGPSFTNIRQIYKQGKEVLAKVVIDENMEDQLSDYHVHPTILDAAFQAWGALRDVSVNPNPYIPVSIDRIVRYAKPHRICWCHCEVGELTDKYVKGNINLTDIEGNVLVSIQGLECKAISVNWTKSEQYNSLLYDFVWLKRPLKKTKFPVILKGNILLFGPELETRRTKEYISQLFKKELIHEAKPIVENKGYDHNICEISDVNKDHIRRQLDGFGIGLTEIFYFASVEDGPNRLDATLEMTLQHVMPLVYLIQCLSEDHNHEKFRLFIITKGAQYVDGDERLHALSASPLWGLGRTISSEYPDISLKMIDIDPTGGGGGGQDSLEFIGKELLTGNKDEDVAYRDGKRYIKTFRRKSAMPTERVTDKQRIGANTLEWSSGKESQQGFIRKKKLLTAVDSSTLPIKKSFLCPDLDGHRIKKPSTGRGEPYFPQVFLHSVISETNELMIAGNGQTMQTLAITALQPLATHISTSDSRIIQCSKEVSDSQLASVSPYAIVQYGLQNLANISGEDRVLIWCPNPVFRRAAVEFVRYKKASAYVMADIWEESQIGNRAIEIHALSTSDPEWTVGVKSGLNHRDITVAFTMTSDDISEHVLESIVPFGKWIDLSPSTRRMKDSLQATLASLNIYHIPLDVINWLKIGRQHVGQIVQSVLTRLCQGALPELPERSTNATLLADEDLSGSLGQCEFADSIHFNGDPVPMIRETDQFQLNERGVYVVAGGTGGLGLEICKWLAGKGVKHLAVFSRSGAKTREAKGVFSEIRSKNIEVRVAALDIANSDELRNFFQDLRHDFGEIKGVFNCTMVLRDVLIKTLTEEDFRCALLPKLTGAIHLHQHTLVDELDLFVQCGSLASLVGSTGQANYAAANAFLDEFAAYRRKLDLPATTFSLGALDDVGVIARNEALRESMIAKAIRPCRSILVIWAMDAALTQDIHHLGIFDVDWYELIQSDPKLRYHSRYKKVIDTDDQQNITVVQKELVKKLNQLTMDERMKQVEKILVKSLSGILKIPKNELDMNRGVNLLGMDSMLSVELVNELKMQGLSIGIVEILRNPTANQLTKLLADRFFQEVAGNSPAEERELSYSNGSG